MINKNYIAHIIYLSLLIAFIPKELDFEFCFAFLLVHVILFLFLNDESLHYLTYFNIGILLFIVNYLYFQSISFTIALIFYAIIFSKSFWSKLIQITFGFILTLLTLIQVNYLKEFDANFWYFFCDKSINLISLTTQNYYLIPFILILIFSIIDTYQNSNKQSFLKKYENNKFIIILSFGFLSLFLVNDLTFNYLLMLIFPISVYISRLINYQKKKYFQEIIFLILILSLILFKLKVLL